MGILWERSLKFVRGHIIVSRNTSTKTGSWTKLQMIQCTSTLGVG